MTDHLNPMLNTSGSPPSQNDYISTGEYAYSMTTPSGPIVLDPQTESSIQNPLSPQADQMDNVYYPGMENIEQPMFDLNDLQNFFEWENSENGPPPTGVDGLGPLGWNNLSSMQ